MDNKEIFDRLNNCQTEGAQFVVFSVDGDTCYFGKDQDGNTVFMIPSTLKNVPSLHQKTTSLGFFFNRRCSFELNGAATTKVVHILTCKEKGKDRILAFIRLTRAFAQTDRDNDQLYLAKLFSSLSALFDKKKEVSSIELQGLFAELYTILHFRGIGCDISECWQSRNMMKFDFTLTEKKRIEIKSTLKASRTHHFKHDQLLSELYDIRVVSIMLRRSDVGISLGDLVDEINEAYSTQYPLLMHIEALVSHIDRECLYEIQYDPAYIKANLRYYDAVNIPHFNEKTPDGVFNAEYDCALDTAIATNESEIVSWIREG